MLRELQSSEIKKILNFLNEIGINCIEKKLDAPTFLPGLTLGQNCIFIDFEQLLYPGDILHEAGHLAVTTSEIRNQIGTDKILENWPTDGEEIGAILWSFAAATHLKLPLSFVFHPNGYKNGSDWLIKSFTNKNYIGLPLLEWMGLTLSDEKALLQNKEAFPVMQKWIRD